MATADARTQALAAAIADKCAESLVTKEEFGELMLKVEQISQKLEAGVAAPARKPRVGNSAKGGGAKAAGNDDPKSKVQNARLFCRYALMHQESDEEAYNAVKDLHDEYSDQIEEDAQVQAKKDDEAKNAQRGIALWTIASKASADHKAALTNAFKTWKESYLKEGAGEQLE